MASDEAKPNQPPSLEIFQQLPEGWTETPETGLTQEQAAAQLGVSRQTVSNWETEKSYPDIQSVIRMSELYGVSLDLLLKEPAHTPNRYVQYLDESTNIVKSNRSKGKLILISVYLLIWSFSMLFFWVLMEPSDAGGFALLFLANFVGGFFDFAIPVNLVTCLVAGGFGIPGVIFLVVVMLFF